MEIREIAGADGNGPVMDECELRMVQLNCQRAYAVMRDLGERMLNERIDVAILQEPYVVNGCVRGLPACMRVFVSGNGKAALVVSRDSVECMPFDASVGEYGVCAWVKGEFGEMYVMSVYCGYGEDLEPYLQYMDSVLERLSGCEIVLGMDANAESDLWFSKGANRGRERRARGRMLEEWLMTNEWGLYVLNEPSVHYTFNGPMGRSDIDVTLTNVERNGCMFEWVIRSDWGLSDHNTLLICMKGCASEVVSGAPQNKWCMKDVDWNRYELELSECAHECDIRVFMSMDVDGQVRTLTEWIHRANDACMKRMKGVARRGVSWWTNGLSELRKVVRRKRKRYQRARRVDVENARNAWDEWMVCAREYKRCMHEAKEKDWRDFVGREGNDPWGGGV